MDPGQPMQTVWLSDGLSDGLSDSENDLAAPLQRLGPVEMLTPSPGEEPLSLMPPPPGGTGLSFALTRPPTLNAPALGFAVRVLDGAGAVIARLPAEFAAGSTRTLVELNLPSELRNRAERVDVEGRRSAGSTALLDERWRRRPVGLVSGAQQSQDLPLLADLYYLDKALSGFTEIRHGSLSELMQREVSLLALADVGRFSPEDAIRLRAWVEQGGVLLRFAGPRMSGVEAGSDPFLPVPLRLGGRTLGGTLSWDTPKALAPFPETSPLAGLTPSSEVRVASQVLAQPGPQVAERTWAALSDGTPLVTGAAQGRGWVVLVHTTANTDWSNLPLSGTFVEMLRRLLDLSAGVAGEAEGERLLPPLKQLDGLGRLNPAGASARAIPTKDFPTARVSPRHPPGYYGPESARRALNLAPSLPDLRPIISPQGVTVTPYTGIGAQADLRPWLLTLALVAMIADTVIALGLQGRLRPLTLSGVVLLALTPFARAEEDFATRAALETRLAYVQTGQEATDRIAEAGLAMLTNVLQRRTAAELSLPMAVDVEKDPLVFFPLLYWPIPGGLAPPSPAALEKVNDYLRRGGVILFDTRGDDPAAAQSLKSLLNGLDIPALIPTPKDHVLNRSFYLLDGQPGRTLGPPVWVAAETEINDGVTPVIVGGNDWAGAWAADPNTEAFLLPVAPGGERQREMSLRFGVNLVMYALTGNYKTDQVHLPAILERLTQ